VAYSAALRGEFGLLCCSKRRVWPHLLLYEESVASSAALKGECGLHGCDGLLEDLCCQLRILLGDAHGRLDPEHLAEMSAFP
jgi:hypothetical protein